MRLHALTALLVIALLAPFASSVMRPIPSDGTGIGSAGGATYSYVGSVTSGAFPTLDSCMRMGSKLSWDTCSTDGSAIPSTSIVPYMNTVHVVELICAVADGRMAAWHADTYIDIAVYELQGDSVEGFERNKLGAAIRFTVADDTGVSRRSVIGLPTSITSGQLQIGVSAFNLADAEDDNAFACVLNVVP